MPRLGLLPLQFAPFSGVRVAWALVLSAIPVSRLAGQSPERYSLQGERIAIYNLAGALRVEAGSGNAVVIEVARKGADARELRIETGMLGTVNALRVIYPEDDIVYRAQEHSSQTQLRVNRDGTFGGHSAGGRRVTIRDSGAGVEAYADLRVLVPPGRRVSFNLGVGEASLTNVDGDILVDTGASPVAVTNMKGSLSIDTGSGSVRINGAAAELSIDTGSGEVTLNDIVGTSLTIETGSGEVTGEQITASRLKVETGSGEIDLANVRAPDLDLNTGSGSIDLRVLGAVQSLRIETGSGDVTVTVPPELGGEVYIETGSGDIEVGFPIQLVRRREGELSGRIGSGNGQITIETGSGGVTLKR